MKRSFACLSFVFALCSVPDAKGQEPAPRTITVTGSSTVRFQADSVRILYRIRNNEPTADEARKANQKAAKLVDEKLTALKMKDLKITYAQPSLAQQTERVARAGFAGGGGAGGPKGAAMQEVVRSFSCSQAGTLILREADKDKMADALGKIEKALAESGVLIGNPLVDEELPIRLQINSSGLTVTAFRHDDSEFREEALTKAVQNAMRKANAIAKGAGVQIKETISIVENEVPAPEPATRVTRPTAATAATASTGELEITVRVTVRYSFQGG